MLRGMTLDEREITTAVTLAGPDGRLRPEAVGWSRRPLHGTDAVTRGPVGRLRAKRWEYWAVTTPTHAVGLVLSDISYAGVHGIFVLDRRTGEQVRHDVTAVGRPGTATLPGTLGLGPARGRAGEIRTEIEELPGGVGTRLRAAGPRVRLDVLAHRPDGHESLAVVVPWSERLYQYTVKDVCRPAEGTLWVDGEAFPVPSGESWATLDHGRGRWPYDIAWNWGAGSGVVDGRVVGVQVGGRWTDGTGSTENSLLVDGRLTKIGEELTWTYDAGDWLAPWRVTGEGVDLTFTPEHLREAVTDLKILASRTHQAFGTWSGTVRDETGQDVRVDGVYGWAEDVHNRW